MMEYKGYTALVEYDDSARAFHGRLLGIRDVVNFEADTVDDLEAEFRASVDDYLEFCAELGREPQRPYSGRFIVRIDPALHQQIHTLAQISSVSMNQWVASTLASSVADSRKESDLTDEMELERTATQAP